jgi:RND family efflux transporter MFP subunit
MRMILLGLSIAILAAGCGQNGEPPPPPKPPEVKYALAESQEVIDYEDFTGRTDAIKMVEVRARATGYLDKINFKDGDDVKAEQVLFEIDARPYKSAWEKAVYAVKQTEATLDRATKDFKRKEELLPKGGASQEEFDKAQGDMKEAAALLKVQKSNEVTAKIKLDFTKVQAPLSGRVSRRLQDPGNLIKEDDTLLTTIVQLDPMYVYFAVDERTVLNLRRKGINEGGMIFWMGMSDEEDTKANARNWAGFPHEGKVGFVDNKLDPGTGTRMFRGEFKNPIVPALSDKPADYRFFPGLFVRVRLEVSKPQTAVVVPELALGTDQGQKFVYVITDKNEAEYRAIQVGALHGDKRVIEKGVAAGEKVIVSGIQRVRKDDRRVVPLPAK